MSANRAPANPVEARQPVPSPVAAPSIATAPTQAHTALRDPYQMRDLKAQEDMAFWALWMFVAAVATFAITSIGTILIWAQVKFTRRAVEEAVAGTEAMREANAIARETGQAQARCYLSAKDAKFRVDQHGTPYLRMVVLNSGQSPARNFRWAFQVRVTNITDDWTWENQPWSPAGGRDISAQQQEPLELGLADGQPMSQGQLSDLLLDPHMRITLSANVEWTDVFKSEWREIWRFQASGPLNLGTEISLFPDFPSVAGMCHAV